MHEWAQRVRRDWRPFEEERYGGWWFGFAEGITKRANCALVVDPDADVSEVTSRYSARGLSPCVQVWPGEEAVDRRLADHGYRVVEPTLVLAREIDERPEGPGTSRIDDTPGPAWTGRPETRILGQVHTAYGVAERDLGRGAVVLDGESVGVCAMFTEPHARGRGTAGRLLADLLGWAHDRGARRAYLCVVADNVSALRSYERSGFTGGSEYHNRLLP